MVIILVCYKKIRKFQKVTEKVIGKIWKNMGVEVGWHFLEINFPSFFKVASDNPFTIYADNPQTL